tara:strand:- start:662 stop:904 length:243 start_codon:yes stop_codon:yes gene_type:complete
MNFDVKCLTCNCKIAHFFHLKKGVVETFCGPASVFTTTRNLDIEFKNNQANLYCGDCKNFIGFKNKDKYILLHNTTTTFL